MNNSGHTKVTNVPAELLPPANEVCEGYVFTGVCLSTGGHACFRGGVCASQGGVRASGGVCMVGGHAWLQGNMRGCGGGMCGCKGVCVVAGGTWLQGGHAWDMTRYGQ